MNKIDWTYITCVFRISDILMYVLLPFFAGLTIWGTQLNLVLYRGEAKCFGEQIESGYPSLVFYLLISYSLIMCYLGLILYAVTQDRKSKRVRRQVFILLRKLDSDFFQEVYDSAYQTTVEEVIRRHEIIKTLKEFGIFFVLAGLVPSEFRKIKCVDYEWSLKNRERGIVRCNVCLRDFKGGDSLKEWPKC